MDNVLDYFSEDFFLDIDDTIYDDLAEKYGVYEQDYTPLKGD